MKIFKIKKMLEKYQNNTQKLTKLSAFDFFQEVSAVKHLIQNAINSSNRITNYQLDPQTAEEFVKDIGDSIQNIVMKLAKYYGEILPQNTWNKIDKNLLLVKDYSDELTKSLDPHVITYLRKHLGLLNSTLSEINENNI